MNVHTSKETFAQSTVLLWRHQGSVETSKRVEKPDCRAVFERTDSIIRKLA